MARNVKTIKSQPKKKVKFEVSAGIFLFRREKGKVFWLLLHYPAGHWDFVKGHIEKNEKIEETIRRETWEETGIKNFYIFPGFKKVINYWFNDTKYGGSGLIHKKVVLLLGETKEKEIKISPEHTEGKWVSTEEVLKIITFKNVKKFFIQAVEFLKQYQISA